VKTALVVALLLSGVSGLLAAFFWYKSSKFKPRFSSIDYLVMDVHDPRRILGEIEALYRVGYEGAKLNSLAARWSAAAAASGAIAGILGLWISN
jgi:hypothetical protein